MFFFLVVNSLVYWSPQGYKVVEVQTIVNGRIHNDWDKKSLFGGRSGLKKDGKKVT